MQYSFTCPLEGCKTVMLVEAENDDEAVDRLMEEAKEHLVVAHPDVKKTEEEIRKDIQSHMIVMDSDASNKI